MLDEHPIALLRHLQTLLDIRSATATTNVFPASIELMKPSWRAPDRRATANSPQAQAFH